jgi:ubiquinone/menaquinone biosynthesis C-methylase UbiE
MRLKTTKQHTNYWANRDIDWVKSYTDTWNHPHRNLIVDKLKSFQWVSLLEIGCASGPNLVRIAKDFPSADLGGIDVSARAVETINNIFVNSKKYGWFRVGSGEDVMMSDSSTDVALTDMTLIYVGPSKIKKYIKEMHRIARKRIVLCEFHSTNPLTRLVKRLKTGYNLHNYPKLLEEAGFYDVEMTKLTKEDWPGGGMQEKYAYIITAKK